MRIITGSINEAQYSHPVILHIKHTYNTEYCFVYLTFRFIEPGRSGRTQVSKGGIFHHRK